jgi:hypothetical protein
MTSIPHEGARSLRLIPREVWPSLAISVMWLAVLFASVFGPDIVTRSTDGSGATIPSGVAVAFFAFLGSWVLARRCFGRSTE